MSTQVTINKMKEMRLLGMYRSYENMLQNTNAQHLTPDEVVDLLIEAEWTDRVNRRINRYLKSARFRYQATIEEIDYQARRNLDKNQLFRLADCSFIDRKETIIITGPTGVGKSYLASALGHQACLQGYRVLYFNTNKLFTKLNQLKADAGIDKEIRHIARHDLLILDDFGLKPLDQNNRYALLEIIEDRHHFKSTIFTSQLPLNQWHEVIGDQTVADAILDRIAHNAHRIELKGESMRKLRAEKDKKSIT